MKTKLLFFILLMMLGTTAMAQSGNLKLRTPRQIAVLIGYDCREKENNPAYKITYAEEVEMMRDCLLKRGFEPENILCMIPDAKEAWLRPSRENVFAVLNLVAANLTEPEDSFVVMLAGFGGMAKETEWFLPIGSQISFSDVWINVEEIYACLKNCKAGKKLFIDLCGKQVIYRTPEEVQSALEKAKTQKEPEQFPSKPTKNEEFDGSITFTQKGPNGLSFKGVYPPHEEGKKRQSFLTQLLKDLAQKEDMLKCFQPYFPASSDGTRMEFEIITLKKHAPLGAPAAH